MIGDGRGNKAMCAEVGGQVTAMGPYRPWGQGVPTFTAALL